MSPPILTPMSDTARNIEHLHPVSADGFADLFAAEAEAVPSEPIGTANGTAVIAEAVPGIADGNATGIPVDQAAKLLGISANAVIKRLNKGKLQGFKVAGQFGPKWMVYHSELPSEPIQVDIDTREEQPLPGLEQPGNAFGTACGEPAKPGTSEGIASESIKVLAQVIQMQTNQIQVQNDLIKHLTNELKDRDTQVKLLTDKQQQGWWTRFSSWFLRSQ